MLYAAILLGLAGSLHCAGMCSPLMLAVTSNRPFLITKIVYNLGRVSTYGLLGMVAATMGSWFAFTNYQAILSFAFGSVLVLLGLVGISGANIPFVTPIILRLTFWVKGKFGWALKGTSLYSRFLLGALNGLLPCGLTYLALTACFLLPGPIEGLTYMVSFGLGTWPVMIGVGWVVDNTFLRHKIRSKWLTQVALVLAGTLLIARVWWVQAEDIATVHAAVGQAEILCP
jgi:sulfite exporter TauE/SafE